MYCGQRLSASSLPSRVATASATNIRSNLPRDIDALVLSLDALAKAIGRNAMATADDILVRVGRQSQRVKDRDIGRSQTEYRPHSAAGTILMAAGAIFSLPKTTTRPLRDNL